MLNNTNNIISKEYTVLYIAGYGRSGSTMLEQALSPYSGVTSVGEINRIWERGIVDNELCECGRKFNDCDFWTEVLNEAFGSDYKSIVPEVLELKRKVDRIRFGILHLFPDMQSDNFIYDLNQYRDILKSLYNSVYKICGSRVIVDASKDPIYGLCLNGAIGGIRTLHLIRDPRAVAFSWKRKKKRIEITSYEAFMPIRSSWRSSLDWLIYNELALELSRRSPYSVRVFYEELVDEFDATLSAASASLDIKLNMKRDEGGLPCSENAFRGHGIGGNPIRFNGAGLNRISPDQEWRLKMSNYDKWVSLVVSWPFRLRLNGRYR